MEKSGFKIQAIEVVHQVYPDAIPVTSGQIPASGQLAPRVVVVGASLASRISSTRYESSCPRDLEGYGWRCIPHDDMRPMKCNR